MLLRIPYPGFTPASLFAASEAGAWYDPSDLSTLWQDSGRTTPVTAHGDPVGAIDDKSGNGNHLIQATASARPLYQVSSSEKFLLFDGVDDRMFVNFAYSQPWDRVSAIRQVGWGLNDRIFHGTGSGDSGLLYQSPSTPSLRIYSGTAGPSVAGPAIGANGVITERHNGASSRIALNNDAYVTANAGTTACDRICVADKATLSAPSNMRFYGMVLKAGTLTDTEIANLRTYLGNKCGVAL